MASEERSEFEERRIRAAVNRGDMATAKRLLGPVESRDLSWGVTIYSLQPAATPPILNAHLRNLVKETWPSVLVSYVRENHS